MMCTASAATSAGPTTRVMQRNTELVAALVQIIAEQMPGEIVWPGSHRHVLHRQGAAECRNRG
jgi:hypothetical protein